MMYDDAVALSRRLTELGQSHTLAVGVHDDMVPRLTCRIKLHVPPGGIDLQALNRLELETGYEVNISFLDGGLYIREVT